MRGSALALLMLTLPSYLVGQKTDESSTRDERSVTVTAGIGNALGWFGLQGERYFAGDRLSGFLGVGYTISDNTGDPSGATFAAGLRAFTAGLKHRGFAELSVSQIATLTRLVGEGDRFYGPGLQVGYQFASRGGFTAMVSGGLGYAPGTPEGEKEMFGMGGLSLGYTWRR